MQDPIGRRFRRSADSGHRGPARLPGRIGLAGTVRGRARRQNRHRMGSRSAGTEAAAVVHPVPPRIVRQTAS